MKKRPRELTEELKAAAMMIVNEADLLNSSSNQLLSLSSETGKAAKQVSAAGRPAGSCGY